MRRFLSVTAISCLANALFFWWVVDVRLQASGDAPEKPYGIAKRVPWTTSHVTGSPEPPPPFRTAQVWPKLTFTNPVELAAMPGTDRLAVLELGGKLVLFSDDRSTEASEVCFDLKSVDGFRRAYGIAFHPQFATNRYVFLCYVRDEGDPNGTRVSRFEVSKDAPYTIDPKSEKLIIDWYAGGHNGGCLRFGPDGCLYITSGDGATPSPPDARNTGQDISDLLSSVLRIDVDHPEGAAAYAVPADNPFREMPNARPEVWAYGFRNPWKIAFDPFTGELWLGDVGWEMWEMVFRIERGGNYGWSLVEGLQQVRPEGTPGPTPVLPAVVNHSHTESRSITGGIVYRGKKLPDLTGAYVYGDYVTGKIWALRSKDGKLTSLTELVDTSIQVVAFGEDADGELYLVGYDGSLHELITNDRVEANRDFPQKLSDTGLFASVGDQTPAPGVIPYNINAEPWGDGAKADRMIAIPGSPTLDVHTEQNVQAGIIRGAWAYPSDTVFVKTLSLPFPSSGGVSWKPVETQMLHMDGDTWRAYAYAWNDEATDATLVPAEGASRTYTVADAEHPDNSYQQTWHIAGRTECIVCHTTRAGSIHGFNRGQLNRDFHFGGVTDNQLRTYEHIGLVVKEEPKEAMPSPWNEELDLVQRGRAYLHVNCAHCHRRGGGGTAKFELQYELPLEKTLLIGDRPTQGSFKIPFAQNVSPGDPYHSVLLYRMAKLGPGRMPHAGSGVVDERGLQLIREWINALPIPEGSSDTTKNLNSAHEGAVAKLVAGSDDAALSTLFETTSGALRLLFAIDDDQLPDAVRDTAIARGISDERPEIRDLFERFVPEEQRVKRLGTAVNIAELLAKPGDVERGKKLFFNTEGVQCKSCHKIGTTGNELGPNLTQIAKKFSRVQLLESILEPSKNIDPKFVPYLVETTRGRVYTGLLVSKSETEYVLRDGQNKELKFAANEIELITPQQKSLMPELLLRDMTVQQVADLLEYLGTLKD